VRAYFSPKYDFSIACTTGPAYSAPVAEHAVDDGMTHAATAIVGVVGALVRRRRDDGFGIGVDGRPGVVPDGLNDLN
jgi:hypothetical protein